MLKLKPWMILRNQADGGDAGGAGGGTPAADGGATPAGNGAGATPAARLLAAGAGAQDNQDDWIPEKYRVAGADGKLDIEASARKLAEGYGAASKRIGSGDIPPAEVGGYKINIPEAFKEATKEWDQAGDQKLQGFLANAHKAGMTQGQLDVVMGQYFDSISGMQPILTPEQQAEKTASELTQVWQDDATFDKNVQAAYKAAPALAQKIGVPMDQLNAELGNNPLFLRLAAALAPEMQEDTPAGTGGEQMDSLSFEAKASELRAQKAALPENDPRRKVIQAELDKLYARRYPEPRAA